MLTRRILQNNTSRPFLFSTSSPFFYCFSIKRPILVSLAFEIFSPVSSSTRSAGSPWPAPVSPSGGVPYPPLEPTSTTTSATSSSSAISVVSARPVWSISAIIFALERDVFA